MTDNFTAKYIWTHALTYVYSLSGEILLIKIVKINLTNQIKAETIAKNLRNTHHLYMPLQQGNLYDLQ